MKKLAFGSFIVLSALLSSCNQNTATVPASTTPTAQTNTSSSEVKVLTDFASQSITALGADGQIVFSKPTQLPIRPQGLDPMKLDDVRALTPGTIIASAPTPTAPYGLMRRVTGVKTQGNQVVVETEAATLEDALTNAHFAPGEYHLSQKVNTSQPIYVQSGNVTAQGLSQQGFYTIPLPQKNFAPQSTWTIGTGEQRCIPVPVTNAPVGKNDLKACYQFNNSLTLDLKLDWVEQEGKIIKKLQVSNFVIRIDGDNTAGIHSDTGLNATFTAPIKTPLVNVGYEPITFFIGPVPVVITPGYRLGFEATGNIQIDQPFNIDVVQHMALGAQYQHPEWTKIKDFSIKGNVTPNIAGSLNAKARFTNDASVIFYGVAGPEIGINPYFKAQYDLGKKGSLWLGADGYMGLKGESIFNFLSFRFNWQKESLLTEF